MKHVTFTKPMRPYGVGDRRILPDDLAARLVAEGAVAPNPPNWPEKPISSVPRVPIAAKPLRPRRPHGGGADLLSNTYLTK